MISWYGISVLLLSGVCLYAAALHLIDSLRGKLDKAQFGFAGVCLIGSAYGVSTVLVSHGLAGLSLVDGERLVLFFNCLLYGSTPWFVASRTGVRPLRFLKGLAVLSFVFAIVNQLSPWSLQFSAPPVMEVTILPWGEKIIQAHGPLNPLFFGAVLVLFSMLAYLITALAIYWRKKRTPTSGILFIAAVLYIGCVIESILVRANSIDWISFGMFGFLCMITALSLSFGAELRENLDRSNRALREQEEYQRILFQQSQIPLVVMDAETGCYLDCNTAAVKIYKYNSREEVLGKTPLDVSAPTQYDESDSAEASLDKIEVCRKTGSNMFEWRHRRPDGEIWDADVHLMLLHLNGREIIQFSLYDITERKRLEARLAQSQKMESIGRLAGGIAHDFNNMLGVILGFAEVARQSLEDDHPVRVYVDQISRAAQRSGDITRQLLVFSRREPYAPQAISLPERIRDAQRTLSRLITEDISMTVSIPNDLWIVNIDPTQFDQILINLVVNARDAMSDGGTVNLYARNRLLDASEIAGMTGAHVGEYVELTVSDTGTGMSPETLKHVFEPFYTTKAQGKGTGLGLATVYGIMTQCGGFIDVTSSEGWGTTFNIFFPRATLDEADPVKPEPPLEHGAGTILLVEDDEMVGRMAKEILEQMGYAVLFASDPNQALSLCQNPENVFDMMLTDVIMPGMNGRELADHVLLLRPHAGVLFMSGYTSDLLEKKGVFAEHTHFIRKPFTMGELNAKIREVLDERARVHLGG